MVDCLSLTVPLILQNKVVDVDNLKVKLQVRTWTFSLDLYKTESAFQLKSSFFWQLLTYLST